MTKKTSLILAIAIALFNTLIPAVPATAASCSLKSSSGIDVGDSTGYAWSKSGKAYSWGRGDWGQRGDGKSIANTNKPGLVKSLRSTVKISASGGHALFLQKDGKVYATGYNDEGQLGNNSTSNTLSPSVVKGLPCIVDIATGNRSSFALSKDGKVYAWGYNADGELGLGNSWPALKASLVPALKGIKKIFAADYNLFALDAKGSVFGTGWNHSNQLGEDFNYGTVAFAPVTMPQLGNVKSISFYDDHASATTLSGEAIVWGTTYRILEKGDPLNGISIPAKIGFDSSVRQIESGKDQTFIVSDVGDLYSWGGHNFGALGNGREAFCGIKESVGMGNCGGVSLDGLDYNVFMDKSLILRDVNSVSSGDNFSVALKQDGTVWSWGAGKEGQLGNGYAFMSTEPVQVYKLNLNK